MNGNLLSSPLRRVSSWERRSFQPDSWTIKSEHSQEANEGVGEGIFRPSRDRCGEINALRMLVRRGFAFPIRPRPKSCFRQEHRKLRYELARTTYKYSLRNRVHKWDCFLVSGDHFLVQGALTIMFGIFRSRSMALKAATSVAMSCCISSCDASPCFFNSAWTAACCVVGGKSEELLTSPAR